jgi:solute carrier family 25 carnitine/acylcarnitine transporter 20/29
MQERTNNTDGKHNNSNKNSDDNNKNNNNNKGIKQEENDNLKMRMSQYKMTSTNDNNDIARGESSSIADEECSEQDDSGMMWKDFVAGNFGGIAGIIAGHPFDTVKTRIQTNPKKYSTNVFKCLVDIVRNESIFGLYKGMASPVIGVGILNALIFGVYGNTLRFLDQWRGITEDSDDEDEEGSSGRKRTTAEFYTDIFIAGALGGLVNCAICSPLELVKTRLQIQDSNSAQVLYKGPIDCIVKTYRHAGFRGIFRGMNATILRDMPSYGIYFVGYEFFKSRWGESPFALLMAGGSAGVFCWILSYPFDVVKSRIQALPDPPIAGHDLYKGVIDCTVKSCKQEGYGVLFRGLNSAIVRAFPVNAVTFFTYEMILKILNGREEDDDDEDDDESL